jgi:hypothetical protein
LFNTCCRGDLIITISAYDLRFPIAAPLFKQL